MGEITPYIFKHQMPRSRRWPLRYLEIETAFGDCAVEDCYLDVLFRGIPWGDPSRNWPVGGGAYTLATLTFNREWTQLFSNAHSPWSEDADPTVVRVEVESILQATAVNARLRRDLLAGLLQREVAALASGGLFRRRWRLWLGLWARPNRLEAVRTTWTGIREDEPVRTLLALEDEA